MALVKAETLTAQMQGFSRLPAVRQIGLLVGLAASVALGVAVVLWSQSPSYSLLYGSLSDKDAAEVAAALEKAGIEYRFEPATGAVLVPADAVHEARLKLASDGLPKANDTGFELLDKDPGLGTSRFMETARYQRALEGELGRSIAALDSVASARVHLAIPKQSVFVRNRSKLGASVLLNLYAGRNLDPAQVAAIVHMVASSVPDLEPEQVTVVDQKGRLLTDKNTSREVAMSGAQFDYTRRLEENYVKRITEILAPIVGPNGVSAQVVADVDFTSVEKTSESYLPENMAVRSEQTSEERSSGSGPMGIPGALSNQPPPGGTTAPAGAEEAAAPVSSSRRVARNYELDRSISHVRMAPGTVRRLSVAVVVDYREQTDDKGQLQRVPRAAEEMERITALVKEAVGFSTQRGDSTNVINASFQGAAQLEPAPEPRFWEQSWFWSLIKQGLGVLGVALLVLGVLRPVLRSLADKGAPRSGPPAAPALPGANPGAQLPFPEDRVSLSGQHPAGQLTGGGAANSHEQQLQLARSMVQQDPKRVAQVVKTWVSADG